MTGQDLSAKGFFGAEGISEMVSLRMSEQLKASAPREFTKTTRTVTSRVPRGVDPKSYEAGSTF